MIREVFGSAFFILMIGCAQSDGGGSSSTPSSNADFAIAAAANVLPVTVGSCLGGGIFNQPCVSVTICAPGTNNCQTIPNLLLDTGSYGLRIFSSVIHVPLTQATSSNAPVAECAQFGTASTWGPVKSADVVLSGEPAVTVPIQVIDSSFPTAPSACSGSLPDPQSAGFNGILGVGLFPEDCGPSCVNDNSPGVYFSCPSGNCSSIAIALNHQVTNPVAALPVDNNGVILALPNVPIGGVTKATGGLILGIGTSTNNAPGTAKFYQADTDGHFVTQFNGTNYSSSFIDSGSNGLFFNAPSSMPSCTSGNADGFYCPTATTAFSATLSGVGSSQPSSVNFNISNAQSELSSNHAVFSDIGASLGALSQDFDWGIPFFFGRKVFVGLYGTQSQLGTGPYWAF